MRPESLFIAGIGAYIPESISTQQAVEQGLYDARDREAGGWLGAAVAGDLSGPEMAVLAATQAMDRSGHAPGDIDILIHADTYHQGPDIWPPHHYIQRHTIGCGAPAVEIRQGCTGMLCAMELAACFLDAASGRTAALLTAGDNFGTPQVDRWRYDSHRSSNRPSIAGDAGTAAVLSVRTGLARLLAIRSASIPQAEEMYRDDDPLFPPDCTVGRQATFGERAARWAASHPDAARTIGSLLVQRRTSLARETLAESGVAAADIARVTHVFSGNPRYVRDVLTAIGIEPSRGVLEFGRRVGHLGANDPIAALDHLVTTGAVGPGDHVLMMANGVGISLACAVLEVLDTDV
jgi:3-oxoacyl-[acyl-carrier-protein] synthase-3